MKYTRLSGEAKVSRDFRAGDLVEYQDRYGKKWTPGLIAHLPNGEGLCWFNIEVGTILTADIWRNYNMRLVEGELKVSNYNITPVV